ncbi:LOW QUALITY PROTEIN: hypothetical protein ACHAXS_006690 [Conticribra weissflogii]
MSFNFSLDDEDNEDDDIELNVEGFDDTGLLALASREKEYESSAVDPRRSSSNIRAVPPSKNNGYNEEDYQRRDCDNDGVAEDDGDWSDDIDWQDDDDENYGERDHPEPSFSEQSPVEVCIRRKLPSHGVTINFGSLADEDGGDDNDDRKKTKKRKRAPTPKVLRSIPVETQLLIRGIRRVQLLCYLAVGSRCSYICGRNVMNSIDSQEKGSDESEHLRDLLSHIAFSLVPLKFHDGEVDIEKSNETKEITDAKTSGQITRNSNLWKNQPSTPHSTTSENPIASPRKKHYVIPTKAILRQFSQWFFQFVNHASNRRREIIARNIAMDASSAVEKIPALEKVLLFLSLASFYYLCAIFYCVRFLSLTLLDNHHNRRIDTFAINNNQMRGCRSIGWRARYVSALNPLPLELTVDHPLLESSSTCSKKDPLFRHRRDSSNVDQKPPANLPWKDHLKLMQQMIQFMQEGGVLNTKAKSSSVALRSNSLGKSSYSVVGEDDTIDLLSSSDDQGDSNCSSSDEKKDKPKMEQRGRKVDAKSDRKIPQKKQTLKCSGESSSPVRCGNSMSWVEVLCFVDETKEPLNKQIARWVPIDPEYELIDRSESVESILAWSENHDNESRNHSGNEHPSFRQKRGKPPPDYPKKTPVSYVLAVEHFASSTCLKPYDEVEAAKNFLSGVRFTDVTPRYSNAWSRTLRLRGATAKDIVKGGGKCVDEWWSKCLKELTRKFKFKSPSLKDKGVPDVSATKSCLTSSPVHDTKSVKKKDEELDIIEICLSEDETHNKQYKEVYDSDEDHANEELQELNGAIRSEKIPTSKEAFKKSPLYVIPSVLNMQDVLHPDSRKRICGVFKGELVYRRSDVSKALRSKKWLYEGRKVMESELEKPVKKIKARKKNLTKGFKALDTYGISEDAQAEMLRSLQKHECDDDDNEMDSLYGIWQTVPWTPQYVGPNDPIPTNEHRNIELALLNPGLIHIELPQISIIARKLGVPYAPCMLGFEGHGRNRVPTIRGIVIHEHNEALLREAYVEFESHIVEMEQGKRKNAILKRWKRLVVGILTKARLDQEYG